MGWQTQEPDYTRTKPHMRLVKVLQHLGYEVELEASFPPKWVDCYLPELHVAFEADGPQHTQVKDDDRDAFLMVTYALPVYHVSSDILVEKTSLDEVARGILKIVLTKVWGVSLIERRLLAWKAGGNI